MNRKAHRGDSLSTPKSVSLGQLHEQFSTAKNAEPAQAIERLLDQLDPHRSDAALLVRLIQLDVEWGRQRGERPQVADYVDRFPQADGQIIAELIELPPPPPPISVTPRLPSRYRVGKEVGRGGIGSVWRVEDTLLGRPLAAKVLLDPYRANPAANVRLEREALLTGSLQHPGIPPVYDRGRLAEGSCFFTMKLVEGDTFANILSVRDRSDEEQARILGIFQQVAQTVAYAHSQAIIHRDLKPQNVMVGRFGEVQIMDWGMAKRLGTSEPHEMDRSPSVGGSSDSVKPYPFETTSRATDSSIADHPRSLTRDGDVVGTPAYMSPEQAQGDVQSVGPQADVFSLGAILYEILTKSRLYETSLTKDLLASVRKGDTQHALKSLDAPDVDRELAALCRRCLAVHPEDRPQDARDVAEAVADHLLSVQQRLKDAELERKEAEVKAAEERKRRQVVVGLAVAIVLITVVGLAGVSWQWNNAIQSKKVAQEESARASTNFDRLILAVDRMLTRVGNEALDSVPYMKTIRRELLQDALAFYEEILTQEDDSPAIRFEVAEAHRRMGRIEYMLGEYEKAKQHSLDALAKLEGLDDSIEIPKLYQSRATCFEFIARIDKQLNDLSASRTNYERAIELRRESLEHSLDESAQVIGLADALRGYASTLRNLDDLEGAMVALEEGELRLKNLLEDEAENREAWLALAACYQGLGDVASDREEREKAKGFHQNAVDVLKPFVGQSNGRDEEVRAELSRYLNNLAIEQRALEDMQGAAQSHLAAIELRRELARQFPNTPEYRKLLAGSFINLGVIYKLTDRGEEAKSLYLQAIQLLGDLSREFPVVRDYRYQLGITHHNLANYLEVTTRDDEAIEQRQLAIEQFEQIVNAPTARPNDSFVLAVACNDLAIQLERRGRTLEALEAIERAIPIHRDLVKASPDRKSYQATLGNSLGLKGWILSMAPDEQHRDLEESLTLAEEAVALSASADNQRALGAALYRHGRFEEAIEAISSADEEASQDLSIWYLLAMANQQQGRHDEAQVWLERAEQLHAQVGPLPDVNLEPIRQEALRLFNGG